MSDTISCGVRRVLGVGFDLTSRLSGLAAQAAPELLDPLAYLRAAREMVQRSADGARALAAGPASAFSGAAELENKSEIFVLVQTVSLILAVPCTFPVPLGRLVDRAYGLGDFRALWAVEGLGHDYGVSFPENDVVPRRILNDPASRALPAKSLLMLHAGMGLAFAENRIDAVGWHAPYTEVRKAVAEFVALCEANSRPGYVGAALESLGLYIRLFVPRLTASVDQALREVAPRSVLDYFWHGAGRALYFFHTSFSPFSIQQLYEQARREAPDERARRNAVAGLTWAFTLVNQRQPWIMSNLLIAPEGEQLMRDPAFVKGLQSSIIMRFDTTPGAPFVGEFCSFRPGDPRTREMWDELVRDPCARALGVIYPNLRDQGQLDQVFRFHDLSRFARARGGGP